jgi:hypothetical protein
MSFQGISDSMAKKFIFSTECGVVGYIKVDR